MISINISSYFTYLRDLITYTLENQLQELFIY